MCCPLLQTPNASLNRMFEDDRVVEVPLLVPRCGYVHPMLACEVRSLSGGMEHRVVGGQRWLCGDLIVCVAFAFCSAGAYRLKSSFSLGSGGQL